MQKPGIIYGTAWKKEATTELVAKALAAGYRAFDTANQKKHYSEDLAGAAIRESAVPRAELFLQSKYTSPDGQDQRMPYDPEDDVATQVRASFAGSLKNFGVDFLDSFLMHGPTGAGVLDEDDWAVWGEMEALHLAGKAKAIGISNVGLGQLRELEGAKIRPAYVQNRCYAARGWDRDVREHCLANGIVYQGFSLLTANPRVVGHPATAAIAERLNATPAQVVFRFAAALGILPLTGTTDPRHMRDDLEALSLELTAADLDALRALS
ncbi:MAG: aldo/keto reductase [Elusimicrobiota bacterium]|nr:aldo/keto reductase [Elusimicrobiota bacterium]